MTPANCEIWMYEATPCAVTFRADVPMLQLTSLRKNDPRYWLLDFATVRVFPESVFYRLASSAEEFFVKLFNLRAERLRALRAAVNSVNTLDLNDDSVEGKERFKSRMRTLTAAISALEEHEYMHRSWLNPFNPMVEASR